MKPKGQNSMSKTDLILDNIITAETAEFSDIKKVFRESDSKIKNCI
jgi:hypothetical protein